MIVDIAEEKITAAVADIKAAMAAANHPISTKFYAKHKKASAMFYPVTLAKEAV